MQLFLVAFGFGKSKVVLSYKKCARKMLMKLTKGVFIVIKPFFKMAESVPKSGQIIIILLFLLSLSDKLSACLHAIIQKILMPLIVIISKVLFVKDCNLYFMSQQ